MVVHFVERMLIAGRAVWFYLGTLVWPLQLSFIYPRWNISAAQPWQFLFPAALVGMLIILWLARHKVGRGALAAALLYVGVLFPVLGWFDACYMRYCFVADHLQYHAAAVMFALFGSAVGIFVQRWLPGRAWIAQLAIAVMLSSLGVLSWRQSSLYVGATTLYRDTIAKNPDAWLAHHGLGVALASTGEFPEAIIQYETTLRLRPCFAEAENDLGFALLAVGNSPLALTHFQRTRIKVRVPGGA